MLEPALAAPRGHRAAQPIRLAGREARRDRREFYHLFLENRHAERAFEHTAHRLGRIAYRLLAVAPAQVGVHHVALDRPRAHDRHLDHEVVEARGLEPREHRHLCARLDLEHAHGVGALDHGVHRRVLGRDVGERERGAAETVYEIERAADGREHAERKAIDLQKPERIEVVLVPLDHGAAFHRGVFDRHEAREFVARDHEAPDVLREMPRKAHEGLHQREQPPDRGVVGGEPGLAQALGRKALVPPLEILRQPVDLIRREPQRLAHIANRAAAPIGDDGRGQRRAVAAVFVVDILNDLLAPLVLEIDVDVGRLVALLRDEALEERLDARRVDLGDAEREAHRRVRRRAAPLTQDAARAC